MDKLIINSHIDNEKGYEMIKTIENICAMGKGILAADESTGTIKKRFDSIGVENTHENRYKYRNLLFNAEGIEKFISGVITYEETLFDINENGERLIQPLLDKGIVVGIKTDKGLKNLPFSNEKITSGLDDLRERSAKYYDAGARFAKFRCVYNVPCSQNIITENSITLAKYAAISQECGLVPIIEPEVLMDGSHTINECNNITYQVLSSVYHHLHKYNVIIPLTLLKPNMVRYGTECEDIVTNSVVAEMTLFILQNTVPCSVPGILFLSGGMSEKESSECLSLLNNLQGIKPWRLTFSYGRALQQSALRTWGGKDENIEEAQKCFIKRAEINGNASLGIYME